MNKRFKKILEIYSFVIFVISYLWIDSFFIKILPKNIISSLLVYVVGFCVHIFLFASMLQYGSELLTTKKG